MMETIPKIFIMTHGNFGCELIKSLEMITGTTEGVYAVPLMPGDTPERYIASVEGIMREEKKGIMLVDLLGGTPSNCAGKIASYCNVEVVTGVNLAMLIEAIQIREACSGEMLRNNLVEAGRNGIEDLSQLLGGN